MKKQRIFYVYEALSEIITSNYFNQFATYYDPDSATCVNVRHVSDKHDFVSDYHAGSYYDTIKSAINALTYNFRKRNEQMANDNN